MSENLEELFRLEAQQTPPQSTTIPGEGAINALKFFAWLDLIGSIIGALVIWANSNGIGVGVGIAVLAQGVFACALFLVIACIAENLIAIRKNVTSTSHEVKAPANSFLKEGGKDIVEISRAAIGRVGHFTCARCGRELVLEESDMQRREFDCPVCRTKYRIDA